MCCVVHTGRGWRCSIDEGKGGQDAIYTVNFFTSCLLCPLGTAGVICYIHSVNIQISKASNACNETMLDARQSK